MERVKQTQRTATTRTGKLVVLNQTTRVEGGWTAYVLGNNGYAVSVFIPGASG